MSPSIVKTNFQKQQKVHHISKINILQEVVDKALTHKSPIDVAILNDLQGEINIL